MHRDESMLLDESTCGYLEERSRLSISPLLGDLSWQLVFWSWVF